MITRVRVLVRDRTDGLPAGLVEYAQQRLGRLGRHFDRILDVEVEFENESRRGTASACAVDITVHTDGRRHPLAHARETAADARSALDLTLDKVDRQVVKLKEKIKIEKKRTAALAALPGPEEGAAPPGPGLARFRLKLRPETPADAEAALADSVHPFYVFLDERSGEINICYRRSDGGLAIVEPVVT